MNEHNIIFSKNGTCQDFNIPNPIISYMCENPLKSTELFYKLYSTCKYFYPKMKIFPCEGINIEYEMTYFLSPLSPLFNNTNKHRYKIAFPTSKIYSLNFKIFCNNALFHVCVNEGKHPNLISYFFKKFIWHCSNSAFTISYQYITLNEYKLLADASTLCLHLSDATITNPDGTIIPVEELLRIGNNIKNFSFSSSEKYNHYYTNETAQILASLIRPKKFYHFSLRDLPANFNAAAFSTFIKNNSETPTSHIMLRFNENVTRETVLKFFKIITKNLGNGKKFDNIKLNEIHFAKFCGGNATTQIFVDEILKFYHTRFW